jgi:hypothetical protein
MLMAFCVINLNTPFITRSLIYFFVEYPDQKRTLPVLKTMKSRGMTTPALLQCILCYFIVNTELSDIEKLQKCILDWFLFCNHETIL